jgi:hypothetical protein
MSTTIKVPGSLKPLNGFVINSLLCFHDSLEQGAQVRKPRNNRQKQKEALKMIDIGT